MENRPLDRHPCKISREKLLDYYREITQKNTIQYIERDEQKRKVALPENSELFFVDESDFDECYLREYGYVLRGEKIVGRHFARTSIVVIRNDSQTISPFAFSGSMDGSLFEG